MRTLIWVTAAVALLAVCLACGGGRNVVTPEDVTPKVTPMANEETPQPTPPLAGEGTEPSGKIAFVSFRGGDREIYVINADGSEEHNVTKNPADDFDSDFSLDGTRIAFASNRSGGPHLFIMNVDGSDVRQLTSDAVGGLNPRWSNDGTKIVYTRSGDLAIIDVEGGEPTVIMESQPATTADPCRAGAFAGGWSPDDSRITYYSASVSRGIGQVCSIGADGSDIEVLVSEPPAYHVEPDWSPDGRYIAYRSIRDGVHDVWVIDLETGRNANLTKSSDLNAEPSWSPDGEWLALTLLAAGTPSFDIYIMRKDGSDLRRLTEDPDKDAYPAWVP